jgi:putative addiction module killer protein
MLEIVTQPAFDAWLAGLKDRRARAVIGARIERLRSGNVGDVKPVGDGVTEACIHFGPGYRLYWVRVGSTIVILLFGGTKRTQASDTRSAKRLWRELQQ